MDVDLSYIDRDRIGEISRLAICKERRRRAEDRLLYSGGFEPAAGVQQAESDRRKRHEIVCNLYKCVYKESKRIYLTHWYAVMAKGLYLLLKRLGIVFRPIGPETDYHGLRTPYIANIKEIEEEVGRLNPELYREFMKESLQ
jgi:N-acyl amino acid synthase of PEP-CTERM/exosortase system